MIQAQSVLLLYTLSGGVMVPFFPRKCLLHLPGGRVTGEGVSCGAASPLTDRDAERKPENKLKDFNIIMCVPKLLTTLMVVK